jgi:hypothetical protein
LKGLDAWNADTRRFRNFMSYDRQVGSGPVQDGPARRAIGPHLSSRGCSTTAERGHCRPSGTLAYSFGLGKAVVSTPYWHARELLDDGRGILVPFGDSKAIGVEIAAILSNDVRRHAMRKRAYAASRPMTWAQTAKRYLAAFDLARETSCDWASA